MHGIYRSTANFLSFLQVLSLERRRKWQLTSVFLPGEFHGQKSLVGYSPWGRKQSVMTAAAAAAKLLQSCLILCDSIDGSPPGSLILGIFQARVLEWSAIAFSMDMTE